MKQSPARADAGYLYAGVTILIWTGFIIVSRIAGKSALSPFDMTALRLGTSGALLLPWVLWRGLPKVAPHRIAALTAVTGLAYPLLAYGGFVFAPASHGAVLMSGLLPFFTTFIAFFLLGERPGKLRIGGLSLIAAGVGVMASGSFTMQAGPHGPVWIGDLMLIGSSMLWALFSVLIKRWKVRALDVTTVISVTAMLVYLPVYIVVLPKHILQVPLGDILLQAFFQGVIVVCLAMVTYAKATELLGPAKLAVLMSTVPAMGALLAVPLLHEPLPPAAAGGVALVSMGALIGAMARAAVLEKAAAK
ncbi:MAG TPA: DMT family transporter, partial [Stenotrophobium sp.]|jgi:drug/metabolite transporter (DMT)-like permease|nr:DMT family transporter [Stenotrophobium sp.]